MSKKGREDDEPLFLIRICERARLYHYGRWWRGGDCLHVPAAVADRLYRSETAEPA